MEHIACGRKRSWPNLKYQPLICGNGLRKIIKSVMVVAFEPKHLEQEARGPFDGIVTLSVYLCPYSTASLFRPFIHLPEFSPTLPHERPSIHFLCLSAYPHPFPFPRITLVEASACPLYSSEYCLNWHLYKLHVALQFPHKRSTRVINCLCS